MATLPLLAALLAAAPQIGAIYDDPRDRYTLLTPHLINRELFAQLESPVQDFRFGRDLGWLAVAADVNVATQQSTGTNPQSRFHGFFVFDGFIAVRPVEFVDLNLDLVLLNPSASDGFRLSSQIYTGVALHLHYDEWRLAGRRVEIDGLGIDLGPVTLGRGLLVEQIPLEGETIGIAWGDFYFRHLFGGRVFWSDDDLIAFALGALDGRVELQFVRWQFVSEPVNPAAHYVTFALDWPINEWSGFAAEYSARLRDTLETAGMVRFDATFGAPFGEGLHVGWQSRYYGRGFGPRTTSEAPTLVFNTPYREDTYVTNSFALFDVAPLFDQWSHTLMVEARVELFEHVYLSGAGELLVRVLDNPAGEKRVAYVDGHRAPGWWAELYYRVGFEIRPWSELPHRINAYFTNKQVSSADNVVDPVRRRFADGDFVVIGAEVFL